MELFSLEYDNGKLFCEFNERYFLGVCDSYENAKSFLEEQGFFLHKTFKNTFIRMPTGDSVTIVPRIINEIDERSAAIGRNTFFNYEKPL